MGEPATLGPTAGNVCSGVSTAATLELHGMCWIGLRGVKHHVRKQDTLYMYGTRDPRKQ